MERPTLLVYDTNGIVLFIRQTSTIPSGFEDRAIIADAPKHYNSVTVNPVTKEPIWDEYPDAYDEIDSVQDTVIDHEERLLALEAALLGGNE